MEIIEKSIKEIKPYEKNPRKNDEAVQYVMASIREFGFKVPIIIDKNNVVIAGHTRLESAKQLGMKKVPCIMADDLNEEQVKAFRLADNKVSEKAEWDFDLLQGELEDIISLDMEDFGFEFADFGNEEDKEPIEKENERIRTIDGYNLDSYDKDDTEGFYQMPKLEGTNYIPKDLIGFNYMLSSNDYSKGIHFYIDDYQFERIWNDPQTYIEKLSQFDCVLTPDFSLYTDMPMAMKIWNVYRSRLIGQMCQRRGIIVIPTVSWCERETFEFCFDGLPSEATLSISTIGVKRDSSAFKIWKDGVDEMIARLHPETLIVYGGEVEYDYGDINVVYVNNSVTERMKKGNEV